MSALVTLAAHMATSWRRPVMRHSNGLIVSQSEFCTTVYSKATSDCCIVTGGQVVPAHSTVLKRVSGLFKNHLGSEYQVTTSRLVLPEDMDPFAVRFCIEFAYSGWPRTLLESLGGEDFKDKVKRLGMCLRVYDVARTLFTPLLLDNLLEEIARCLPMFEEALCCGTCKPEHLNYLLGYAKMCSRLAETILDQEQAASYEPILRLMGHWFSIHERWTGSMPIQQRIFQALGELHFVRLGYSSNESSELSSRESNEQSSGVLSNASSLMSEPESAKGPTWRFVPPLKQTRRMALETLNERIEPSITGTFGTLDHHTTARLVGTPLMAT
ncbi:hypothetical protein GGR57DRAFT_498451 [Xylariaceae sp. FL1272]|nr:hypothetical protein GGR57DRAFT_498451 [Xylariaceae sp. FL1272]